MMKRIGVNRWLLMPSCAKKFAICWLKCICIMLRHIRQGQNQNQGVMLVRLRRFVCLCCARKMMLLVIMKAF